MTYEVPDCVIPYKETLWDSVCKKRHLASWPKTGDDNKITYTYFLKLSVRQGGWTHKETESKYSTF
jgi:hypothetical protein